MSPSLGPNLVFLILNLSLSLSLTLSLSLSLRVSLGCNAQGGEPKQSAHQACRPRSLSRRKE